MLAKRNLITAALVTTLAFVSLMFSWAVSSPPGSDPDGSFHYAMVWCLRDSPKSGCISPNSAVRDPRQVEIAMSGQCYRDELYRSAKCGSGERRLTVEIDENAYPQPFYFVMNKLAISGISTGALLMRLFNGVLAAFFIVSAILLSERRLRSSFILATLVTLGPLHLALLPSMHAQSWLLSALSPSWVFALLVLDRNRTKRIRLISLSFWLFGLCVAGGSRLEGVPLYVLISAAALMSARHRLFKVGGFSSAQIALVGGGGLLLAQFFESPISVRRWISGPLIPDPLAEGLGAWNWFSSWLLSFPSVLFELYGTQGFAMEMRPPLPLVSTLGVVLLVGVFALELLRIRLTQVALLGLWLSTALAMILFFTRPGLDLYEVDGRYVSMITPAFVGLFLNAGSGAMFVLRIRHLRRCLIWTLLPIGILSHYFFLSRYVTGVQHGLVLMRLGADEWWWPNSPLDPNGVLLFGAGAYFLFVFGMLTIARLEEAQDETREARE